MKVYETRIIAHHRFDQVTFRRHYLDYDQALEAGRRELARQRDQEEPYFQASLAAYTTDHDLWDRELLDI